MKVIRPIRFRDFIYTPRRLCTRRWGDINRRCVNGSNPQWDHPHHKSYLEKGVRLEMTKQEFLDWVYAKWDEFVAIFRSGDIPSIDRINPDGHYSIANLRVIPNEMNKALGNLTRAAKYAIEVTATHIETGEKKIFPSIKSAVREGFTQAAIWRVLSGRRSHHKGWKWEITKQPLKRMISKAS